MDLATETASPVGKATGGKPSIFDLRSSPNVLHVKGMKSSLLSDHPLTQKAARDELLYRQKKLAEAGLSEQGLAEGKRLDGAKEGTTSATASNEGVRDYTLGIVVMLAGYLCAHNLVFSYYYKDNVRLPYDPSAGFVNELREKRKENLEVDALWNGTVKAMVVDEKKAKFKTPLPV